MKVLFCASEALPFSATGGLADVAGSLPQALRARLIGCRVVVALYDGPQVLPLPEMYGKNLTFKTGGVDGCNCEEILRLIAEGRLNTEPLITHTYPLDRIEEAYTLFENKMDGVIKVAIEC